MDADTLTTSQLEDLKHDPRADMTEPVRQPVPWDQPSRGTGLSGWPKNPGQTAATSTT